MISQLLLGWDLQFESTGEVLRDWALVRTQYTGAAVINVGLGSAFMMGVVSASYLSFPASGLCSSGPSHILIKLAGKGV